MPEKTEIEHPVPTKAFLLLRLPTPPVSPFLLKQNLSPKHISRNDIMKLKVS